MEKSATSGLSNEFWLLDTPSPPWMVFDLLHYAFCWLQQSQVTTPNGKPSSAKVKVKRSNGTYKYHCHGHISMGKTHRKHMAKQPLEISSSNNSGNVGAQWCPTCLNRRWANLLSSATVMVCGTFDASIWSSDPCAHCIHHAPFSSWRVSPQWPLQLVAMWPASGSWDVIVTHLEANITSTKALKRADLEAWECSVTSPPTWMIQLGSKSLNPNMRIIAEIQQYMFCGRFRFVNDIYFEWGFHEIIRMTCPPDMQFTRSKRNNHIHPKMARFHVRFQRSKFVVRLWNVVSAVQCIEYIEETWIYKDMSSSAQRIASKDPELIGCAIAFGVTYGSHGHLKSCPFWRRSSLVKQPTTVPWMDRNRSTLVSPFRHHLLRLKLAAFWDANMFGDVTRFSKTLDLTENFFCCILSVSKLEFGGAKWLGPQISTPSHDTRIPRDGMLSSSRLDCLGEPLTENTLDDFVGITWHQLQLLEHLEPHLSAAVRSCQLCRHDIKPSCYTSPA